MRGFSLPHLALLFAVIAGCFAMTSSVAQAAEQNEIVSFRLSQWKAMHMHDAEAAEKMVKTMTQIGCEVKQSKHGDHIDVSFRCPNWKSIALTTHEDAHRWEKWLKEKGFETQHKH